MISHICTRIGYCLSAFLYVVVISGCQMGPYIISDPHGGRSYSAAINSLLGPTPWPDGSVRDAPQFDPNLLALHIHDKVNEIRSEHGISELSWFEALQPVAIEHSRDMSLKNYFDHINPNGEDAMLRALNASVNVTSSLNGYQMEGVGENLFVTQKFGSYTVFSLKDGSQEYEFKWKTIEEIAQETVDAWLESATHRSNLLSPLYGMEAIGVAFGNNETVFITQNLFCGTSHKLADATTR